MLEGVGLVDRRRLGSSDRALNERERRSVKKIQLCLILVLSNVFYDRFFGDNIYTLRVETAFLMIIPWGFLSCDILNVPHPG